MLSEIRVILDLKWMTEIQKGIRRREGMNSLRNFFSGRYGNDHLNIALLLFAMILMFVFRFTPVWYLSYVAYVPLIFMVYRGFSRNYEKRRRENEVFLSGIRKLKFWAKDKHSKVNTAKAHAHDKEHKYYKCPACGAQLRVPSGKGKICITCPRCRKEFIKKT